ncbi:MAG: glucose 1-dehydrogenase [Alphaproteobacteria bacterium]|nr:glucose 1-dehydrogenase [Alphaproteobacteria bacterium]
MGIFDLGGKTAIVTGASRGIGEAIARRLAEAGANVVVSSRDPEACGGIAASINADVGRAVAASTKCHIGRRNEIEALVDFATNKFGSVDVVVANAAVNPHYGPLSTLEDDQFDKVMTANVKSSIWLAQTVGPEFERRGGGSFIIVSSIGAFVGTDAIGVYNMSKAADLQLARNLAVEWGPKGIRANCICPGIVKTKFAEALWQNPEVEKHTRERLPLRRFGEPDDISGAAVFLASDASAWMTGQQIVVDGGALISLATL